MAETYLLHMLLECLPTMSTSDLLKYLADLENSEIMVAYQNFPGKSDDKSILEAWTQ